METPRPVVETGGENLISSALMVRVLDLIAPKRALSRIKPLD